MQRYAVYDTGIEADEIGYPILQGKGWTNSVFDTFAEAVAYARLWLGGLDLLVHEDHWKTCPVHAVYSVTNYIEIKAVGTPSGTMKQYGDQCPCGINPAQCDYHRP